MMENNNNKTQVPPPSYQQGQAQTYYEPPPPPTNYAPPPQPPPPSNHPNTVGARFTQFYAPPQNRKLGIKRRLCSFICCCIIIGLIVGLAAGLTRRNYYGNRRGCDCRVNSDCTAIYGYGTYCYSSCQCARR